RERKARRPLQRRQDRMGRRRALAVAVCHLRFPGDEDCLAPNRDVAAEPSKNIETRGRGGCKLVPVADPKTAATQWAHSSAPARGDGRATGIFFLLPVIGRHRDPTLKRAGADTRRGRSPCPQYLAKCPAGHCDSPFARPTKAEHESALRTRAGVAAREGDGIDASAGGVVYDFPIVRSYWQECRDMKARVGVVWDKAAGVLAQTAQEGVAPLFVESAHAAHMAAEVAFSQELSEHELLEQGREEVDRFAMADE